jgi:lysophospholipase L1-like esterase
MVRVSWCNMNLCTFNFIKTINMQSGTSTVRYLFLLSLLQALYFSVSAQNKFEKDIVAYEKQDQASPPLKKKLIVFAGSSSIVKWTSLKDDFADKNVINRGFGGSQTTDLIEYSDRVISIYKPKQVFIYEGDNDLGAGQSPEQVFNNFQILFDKIRKRSKKVRISFISIKPSPSRKQLIPKIKATNKKIQEFLAEQKNADYIDVFDAMLTTDKAFIPDLYQSDSLHMTPAGYKIWTNQIKPFLLK